MIGTPLGDVDATAISPAFLSRVLDRPIESLDVERIGGDRGFAGVVLRVTLHPERTSSPAATPDRLVAKVSEPADVAGHPGLSREVIFYSDLASSLAAPAPRCWFAGSSPAGLPVVLLEDLVGARPGDAITGAAAEDVQAVLQAMAPIWQLRDHPRPRSWPAGVQKGTAQRRRQQRYANQWRAQRDRWEAALPAEVWRLGEQLTDRLAEVLGALDPTLKSRPTALIHGDLHLDNVLFTGDRPVVLDWATVRQGYPSQDIFPFVATSLPAGDPAADAGRSMIMEIGNSIGGADADWQTRFVGDGRRALLAHFAGVIGWHSRPAGDHPRERALREAALGDGRLNAALLNWDAGAVLATSAEETAD